MLERSAAGDLAVEARRMARRSITLWSPLGHLSPDAKKWGAAQAWFHEISVERRCGIALPGGQSIALTYLEAHFGKA
jgi:hypothetical protein